VSFFSRAGGYPAHIHDNSTGIWYIAAAFDNAVGPGQPPTQDVLILRTNAGGATLRWADGTAEKVVVSATTPAGAPSLSQNHYDPEQSLALLHGARRFTGRQGGETWQDVTD